MSVAGGAVPTQDREQDVVRLEGSARDPGPLRPLADVSLTDDAVWALLDAAPDAVVVVGQQGRILLVNQQAEVLFGYERSELLGMQVETLLPEEQRASHVEHRAAYESRPRTRPMGSGLELAARRADGTTVPVEISLSPLHTDGQRLTIAAIRDVSARRQDEARLAAAQQELALAEERERIARDLHDRVIGRLFAAGMSLESVHARVEDGLAAQRVEQTVEQLDTAIRDIRTVILGLGGERRSGSDVREQLLALAAEAARPLGFEPAVRFRGPVELTVDGALRGHVTAVVREALANVARHARARDVVVEIEAGDELTVRVTDDGVGLPDRPDVAGNGLRNLERRAQQLGGTFDARRPPAGGTCIEWCVPADLTVQA